jgi:hypothetical protein
MRVNDKGEPIHIAGKVYEHGIFCFANSIVVYPVNGKYERFEAEIGVEDLSSKRVPFSSALPTSMHPLSPKRFTASFLNRPARCMPLR